jgi:hypothetical protein
MRREGVKPGHLVVDGAAAQLPLPPIDPTINDIAEWLAALAFHSGDQRYKRACRELQRPSAGQRSPATEEALRIRDEAIREMATFYQGSRWSRCQEVHKALRHYETTAWRLVDRHLEEMPTAYRGTPFAEAFRVLRAGQGVPGPRRLHAIINPGG